MPDWTPRHRLRLIHTADLHIGAGYATSGPGPFAALAALGELSASSAADVVLIAGDFFDHGRVDEPVIDVAAALLERIGAPVVILPGNHDPYTSESPWVRFSRHLPSHVHIVATADGERIVLEGPGLQIWGQAHTHFEDFAPLATTPRWLEDGRRTWRVAMAHGLYVESEFELRFSYRIRDDELAALDAHYVALGHLETHARVGGDGVIAYYASSPIRTGAFTQVDLAPDGIRVCEVSGPARER
jgi:exonuclease SbcD